MAAEGLTYRTGTSARALRTVVVDDVRETVLLLPAGTLSIVTGKLLHGTTCRCDFWAEELGVTGDDFAVPASQVVARRPMKITVRATHKEEQV